jgi:uncharacterized protein (TIGR02588 family)
MKTSRTGEYITFFLSFILVAGLLVHFSLSAFHHQDEEILSFTMKILREEIAESEGRSIIPVQVENTGMITAVSLKLKISAGELESEVDVSYLAPDSPRKIFVILPGTPVRSELSVTPISYSLE